MTLIANLEVWAIYLILKDRWGVKRKVFSHTINLHINSIIMGTVQSVLNDFSPLLS